MDARNEWRNRESGKSILAALHDDDDDGDGSSRYVLNDLYLIWDKRVQKTLKKFYSLNNIRGV